MIDNTFDVVLKKARGRVGQSARRNPPPAVISLFTGAGGFDVGLEAAGFRVKIAVEMDATACATLRANRGRSWDICRSDIRDLASEHISEITGLAPEEPALLAGGPPCQPFSKAAFWRSGDSRRLDDPRADTLTAYLRVLRDLRPKAYVLENVSGLMFRGKDEGLKLLQNTIEAINADTGTAYSFSVLKLNAADYGVPQVRERVFIVGARDGTEFQKPAATHRNPSSNIGFDESPVRAREQWMTAWDSIGDLEDDTSPELQATGRWGPLLASIPEGENYLFHTDRGGGVPIFGWRRRYWGFLLKLAKDRPAWTIQAQPGPATGPFHWKNRRLSARELCRLQTIPDTYHIVGSRTEVQRQIGNAVPSLLAEVLGREIRKQLLGHRLRDVPPKLAIERRSRMPPRERRRPVPVQYRDLIGDHAPHPGTGRGYRAERRG